MSTDPPTTLVPEVPPRQWSFLDDAVTRLIRERATLGAQVSVWTPSTGQHDLSWGTDHRLGQLPPAMLHSTFCVTKPVLAVGALVAPPERSGRVLDTVDEPGTVSVRGT